MRFKTCTVSIVTQPESVLVERTAPGAAPNAFRIWASGENVADDGPVYFTQQSALALVGEQQSRGRRYSIDYDHLSLVSDRPATSGRAAGWHSIEVRNDMAGQPELWAVDVEWCKDAKEGLEQDPPLWRYFSPAFNVDEKTSEITSYINLALCINPLTHGLPALAALTNSTAAPAARKMAMKPEECSALLAAMAEATDDPSKKEAFAMAMAAINPPVADAPEEEKKEEAEGDGEPKESAESEEKKMAEDEEDKMSSKAAAAVAAENIKLKARLDRLEISAELDKRKDLSESVKNWCLTQSIEVVRSFLGKVSRTHAVNRNEKPVQTKSGPSLLEGEEREKIDSAMGVRRAAALAPQRLDDGRFVLHTVRPSQMANLFRKGD